MGRRLLEKKVEIKKPYILYIPENINIDELLTSYPIENQSPRDRDYLVFLLHIIKSTPNGGNTHTQLNSRVLRDNYFKNYNVLLQWLISRGVIVTDNKYFVCNEEGEFKFKGYRFSHTYNVKKKAEVITNKILIKKITTSKDKKYVLIKEIKEPSSSRYGYEEDIWYSSKEIASKLNLKSTLMMKGLRELGQVKSEEFSTPDWYKYFYYEAKGFENSSLKFTDKALEIVSKLSEKYPDLFPQKK